jgi:hypothetical protein
MLGSPDHSVVNSLLSTVPDNGGEMVFQEGTTGHDFFLTSPVFLFVGLVHTTLVNPGLVVTMGEYFTPGAFVSVPVTSFDFVVFLHMLVHM